MVMIAAANPRILMRRSNRRMYLDQRDEEGELKMSNLTFPKRVVVQLINGAWEGNSY